jgi:hypothetical protein
MNDGLSDPLALLRKDLIAAAARQTDARRRAKLTIFAATTAAVGLGFAGLAAAGALPWQTTASPATTTVVSTAATPPASGVAAGNAAASVTALGQPSRAKLPATARAAFATSAVHFGAIVATHGRLLTKAGTTRLFAAPTTSGAVCFVVLDGSSPAGSCTTTLAPTSPIATIVGELQDGATIVAGIASDNVTAVTALDRAGRGICHADTANNAFLCATSATIGAVASFVITFSDGTEVTQSG